ncbi:MAG: lysophospholipid acyltransferase (LPLAT)-like uncharacterized protein [Lentimonas sp.]|jgi:lysophospholipid acyltransferase (LPLAT)-like uncharacterized protein
MVNLTSRTNISGSNYAFERFKNNQSVIINSWHHQIMMSPFVPKQIRKFNTTKKISSLASKHGDGRFVGKIMEKSGVINIPGSSQDGRKSNRGIDMKGLKAIFRAIKNELGIAITPDGPRGPSRKINGEVVKIAQITGAPIIPVGIGYSKYFELKTWDKFAVPLPFSKICFYYGEPFFVPKNISEEDIKNINLELEKAINLVADKANIF